MKPPLRWVFSVLVLAALLAQPALALDYPLSSEAIRDAYFLGKGDPNRRLEFLQKYARNYPEPESGQYVGAIQLETPFVTIAQRVSRSVSNYLAPDAEQEFLGKPGVCHISVDVYYVYTPSDPPPGQNVHYQMDYIVRLKQHGKEIPIKHKWTETTLSDASAPANFGFELNFEYDADKMDPASAATVENVAPVGKNIVETFDLGRLR